MFWPRVAGDGWQSSYMLGPMEYIIILVSLFMSLLCCGGMTLVFLAMVGFIILRRRGSKNVTAKAAVNAGVESVSQVFVRGKGGLQAADDDDD
jgi:hypothetical protein